ncbi:hypothetical protein [Streptomyces sp. NPDC050485]|uniref:hypothetical protein n=1 Tax=Streptomyces sp. NPDC050485 TaxID=3365617 RepID=UPI0037A17F43
MNDNEIPAVEAVESVEDKGVDEGAVEDKLVDAVVERLMDRADASGAALLGEGGLLTELHPGRAGTGPGRGDDRAPRLREARSGELRLGQQSHTARRRRRY